MDPIGTLVTSVMAVLMPYVAKGAEEFARVAGEAAYNKAKSLLDTLKARLSGDKEATDSLTRFEEKPERYQPVVEDILKEKLAEDQALAEELKKLLKEMGPELEIIQKMRVGKKVVGLEADEIAGGQAKVTQEIDEAEDVTGAKFGRIG
jgi:vacuolar-type H+-ATPase subunit I/STV1